MGAHGSARGTVGDDLTMLVHRPVQVPAHSGRIDQFSS